MQRVKLVGRHHRGQHVIRDRPTEPQRSIDPDYRIPCDVHLPVNTTIKKGCRLATLLLALEAREHP
jgi:hypothetical protein